VDDAYISMGTSRKPGRVSAGESSPAVLRRSSPWHAVSIVTKSRSCEAARSLRATRFLSAAAPRLPLEGCPVKDSCPCAYKHHADRRGPARRKDETTGLRRNSKVAEERRVERSRRKSEE
jgi:hypothetical protein